MAALSVKQRFDAEIVDATAGQIDAAIDRAIYAVSSAFTSDQIERALANTPLTPADRQAIRRAFTVTS
jgi:hypothetical protein